MASIPIDTVIPPLELPPISRTTLALYAGASGDHNPIHIDLDFARSAGLEDVFVHGMLSMAYLGRMLTNWQPQAKLLKLSSRFIAITQLHDAVICSGRVVDVGEYRNRPVAFCEIHVARQNGEKTIVGDAVIAL
ncbi:MAG: MaoC/PaaZ C-terminal domain-containing protein [Halioglobus sp.]